MPVPVLDFEDFDVLRHLIHQHSGIWLGDSKRTFLKMRLGSRLQFWNISSPKEYYYFLKYDAQGQEEIQHLIEVITVNETWFFREIGPLQAWCVKILPILMKNRGPLRLWLHTGVDIAAV